MLVIFEFSLYFTVLYYIMTQNSGSTWLRLCILTLVIFGAVPNAIASDKKVIGWIEKVAISDKLIILSAKIDTGARHSSLNAPNMKMIEKDGNSWVKFTIRTKDNVATEFEEPVIRMAKIKRKGTQPQVRPVIHMNLCVDNVWKNVEVNLVNRENFNYQMLVGRSFLQDSFLVDVSAKNMTAPNCAKTTN